MKTDGSGARKRATTALAALAFTLLLGPGSRADVGDVVAVINPNPSSVANYCSIGLAFDGTSLYFDRCGDPMIYEISPADGSLISSFDPGIPEFPNAMAFDAKRNGLWIGCQACNATGMPVYFWDFDDNSVTLKFTVPFGLINPATGNAFLNLCFIDGLAYNENDPLSDADDEIWFSDDVDDDLALFLPDGTFVAGFDATTIDPSLVSTSGLAVGGPNLYMANNGGGDVFRAQLPGLALLDQFTSGDERQEDMECDPVTFAPIEVMWVRTTPQGGAFPDVITAYEIEPGTCDLGGGGLVLDLDIKPGSCPNSYNPKSNGVLPVAVLGTESFDVTTIDLATLQLTRADGVGGSVAPLMGPPGPGIGYEDVATPFEGEVCECHTAMGDGFMDLTLKFKTQNVVTSLMLGMAVPGEEVELVLGGALLDGTPFKSSDCVRIVPAAKPPGMLVVQSSHPQAYVHATPLDDVLETGGFNTFVRSYPPGTVITLTAPKTYGAEKFLGWRVNGVPRRGSSIQVTAGRTGVRVEAIFEKPSASGSLAP
jgi:hypothetical protein